MNLAARLRVSAVRVTAKVDYAVRAAVELAAAGDGPVKGERIAEAQQIPLKFLENILLELKHAGLVQSQRGAEGGYWLARPPAEIALAEVIRAVEGRSRTCAASGRSRSSTPGQPSSYARSGSPCARTCAPCSSASRSRMSPPAACRKTSRGSPPDPEPGSPTSG